MSFSQFLSAVRALGLAVLVAVAFGSGRAQAQSQVTNINSPSVQADINSTLDTGWVQGPTGWTYTVLDNDGDPNDTTEASEEEGYTLGPLAKPDNTLVGVVPQQGDSGATDAQPYDTSKDPTSGGPIDLATGSETFSHTLLSLSGARELDFTITYNSQIVAGDMYITNPSGGGSPYWTLYTPGDLGHWTHNYEGEVGVFPGSGSTATTVIVQISHRRWTYILNGTTYTTFDQSGAYDVLVKSGDGSYTLTTKDQSTYKFTGTGLYLTQVTNPHGQAVNIARNASNQITTITEPVSGKAFTFTYGTTGNSAGRVTTIADSAGRHVSLVYDANSMLTQITEANGGTTSFTYDSLRHLLTESDAQGNVITSNNYDTSGLGFVTSQQDANGNYTNYSYVSNVVDGFVTNQVTVSDPYGLESVYSFDQNHNLVQYETPLDEITSYTYDANGNRLTKTDPLQNVTTYAYDTSGNLTQVTDALGHETVLTYDGRHNLLTSTDADGHTSTFTYDAQNNVLTARDALGNQVARTYDANSLRLTQTNPKGGVNTNTYTAGLLTTRKDTAGNSETLTYDSMGDVSTLADATGATTTFHYGTERELLEVDDAAGNKATNTYDWRLRKLTSTDNAGAGDDLRLRWRQ